MSLKWKNSNACTRTARSCTEQLLESTVGSRQIDTIDSRLVDTLTGYLSGVLENNPDGLSEYELLSTIDNSDLAAVFPARTDTFGLFRAHFLLFHALYRLRRQLLIERKMLLEISALRIVLRKFEGEEKFPEQHDSLAEYYLDIDNYYHASPGSVEAMLSRFRVLFENNRFRAEALAVLGLSDPVDENAIRRAYRELVMQHHPDRGGDSDKAAEINRAFDRLLRQRSGSS